MILAQQPKLILPLGHSDNVIHASFTEDDRFVLTIGKDGKILLWEAVSGLLVKTINLFAHVNPSSLWEFSVSRNGYYVAVYDDNNHLLIYDLLQSKVKKIITQADCTGAIFDPKSKYLVTSAKQGFLTLWDVTQGIEISENRDLTWSTFRTKFHFSQDSSLLAVYTRTLENESYMHLYQFPGLHFVGKIRVYGDVLESFCFDRDRKHILTKQPTNKYQHGAPVYRLNFFTNASDSSIMFEPNSLKGNESYWYRAEKQTYIDEQAKKSLNRTFSLDSGRKLNFASNVVRIVDVRSNAVLHELMNQTATFNNLCFLKQRPILIAYTQEIFGDQKRQLLMFNFVNPQQISIPNISYKDGNRFKKWAPGGFWSASPDENWMLFSGKHFQEAALWNLTKSQFNGFWSAQGFFRNTIAFTAQFADDGNKLMVTVNPKEIGILSLNNTLKYQKHPIPGRNISEVHISADASTLIARAFNGDVKFFELGGERRLQKTGIKLKDVNKILPLSSENAMVVSYFKSKKQNAEFRNARTGKLIKTLPDFKEYWLYPNVCKESKRYRFIYTTEDSIYALQADTLHSYAHNMGWLCSVFNSPMDTAYVISSIDSFYYTTMLSQPARTKFQLDSGFVVKCVNWETGLCVASARNKQVMEPIQFYRIKTGEKAYTLYLIDTADYLVLINSGYYMGTTGAAKRLHYVNDDNSTLGFEQRDLRFNRPDLVLSAIGNKDTQLIHSYRRAWQKRISKMGVDTLAFQQDLRLPVAQISNKSSIVYQQTEKQLKIQLRLSDSVGMLDRYNIWVNDVPVYGQNGKQLRSRMLDHFETEEYIQLSHGENRIEVSALSSNGTENYRTPLFVRLAKEKPQLKVYFIGIGMDRFANSSYNLNYSCKDIRDLAHIMKYRYGDTLQMDTLFNEQFTSKSLEEIKQKLLKTGVDDKVIVAYSGHGLLSHKYDYYLSTYNIDFATPERMGLPYEMLEALLDSIPARQKLMLLDACHSGEVDKSEALILAELSDSLGLSRGATVQNTERQNVKRVGLNNSFELMQNSFVNVGKGLGATIISASAGTQFALERGDLKNGVFTYSILEALKENKVLTVSQLKNKVGQRVTELTGGLQKPNSRNETLYHNWRIW